MATGMPHRLWNGVGALLLAVALAGCASFSADGGFGNVERVARDSLGKEVAWVRTEEDRPALAARVAELLARPLGVEAAVQVALFNNRGLQAAFFELGIGEADLVQAGRLPNPHFSMLRLSKPEGGGRDYEIEQALTFNIFALLTMPMAVEVERRRFEQVQRAAAMAALRLAAETRRAWFDAVAAEETARYMRRAKQAADAGADLARRMAGAGNFSKLRQAREQSFHAAAALDLARAERTRVAMRERLARLLGVAAIDAVRLPERLPDLPATAEQLIVLERTALEGRLDLQALRFEAEALARNLGLTRTTRFIDVLEFGPARALDGAPNSGYKTGYEIGFTLPLFDWGDAKVAKAEAIYMQAVERTAAAVVNARSEVRDAYHAYRSAYDVARHYRDEIVPLGKRVSEENLLRYNGMLIGVFDLLADARAQIASVNGAIAALRDFWIARSDLDMSLLGKPLPAATLPVAAAAASGAAGH